MVMGACPGQMPILFVPPTLMATATMVRACRYKMFGETKKTHMLNCALMADWNYTKFMPYVQ